MTKIIEDLSLDLKKMPKIIEYLRLDLNKMRLHRNKVHQRNQTMLRNFQASNATSSAESNNASKFKSSNATSGSACIWFLYFNQARL